MAFEKLKNCVNSSGVETLTCTLDADIMEFGDALGAIFETTFAAVTRFETAYSAKWFMLLGGTRTSFGH